MRSPKFPLTIIWPAGHPEAAMPAQWHRQPDGRIRATYRTLTELRHSVELLMLTKTAVDLGGVLNENPG